MNRAVKAGVPAFAVVAGLAVGGCYSTPDYGPAGMNGNPYGFTETPIQGGGMSIRVTLPSSTKDPQLAYAYWNRRAEDLCHGSILRKQIHTAQRQVWDYNGMTGVSGDYVLEGYVWCDPAAASPPAATTAGA